MARLNPDVIQTHSDTLIRTLKETKNYETTIFKEAISMADLIYGDTARSTKQVFSAEGFMDAFDVGMIVFNHCASLESPNVLVDALRYCGYALTSNLEKNPKALSIDQQDDVVTGIQALSTRFPGKFTEQEEQICKILGADNWLAPIQRKIRSLKK